MSNIENEHLILRYKSLNFNQRTYDLFNTRFRGLKNLFGFLISHHPLGDQASEYMIFRKAEKSLLIKGDLVECLLWLQNNYLCIYNDVSCDNNIRSLFSKTLWTLYSTGMPVYQSKFPEPRG
jgi:hypothetical protein